MTDTTKFRDNCDRSSNRLNAIDNYLPFLARICLAAIFLWSGINKILHPIATQVNMSAHGMPLTAIFLIAAIALEIFGAFSLLLGIKPRWGATMLIIFLVPATLIFHTDFSTELQQAMFLKNLAMLGGLLMIIRYGGGNIAITKPKIRSDLN